MDTIYTGDIPQSFHYAQFSNYYIDLYDTNVLQANHTYNYYRIYLYDNLFLYDSLSRQIGSYSTNTYLQNVRVTDNIRYRRDFPDIALTIFLYILLFIFLVNLVTSSIKKGGLLGGLL